MAYDSEMEFLTEGEGEGGVATEEMPEETFDFLEEYWATEQDPTTLVESLEAKVRDYRETMRQHPFWNRILRSLEYYHGFFYESLGFDDWFNDTALSTYGDQEELVQIDLNHMRSVLQQIVNIVTQNPPKFRARASNSESKALKQAELAEKILEYYNREKRVSRYLRRAVEDAIVLSAGFVKVTWDPTSGEEMDADEFSGEITYEGDLAFENPKLFDVAWDLRVREWEQVQWVICRGQENKWDLAAEFPEFADDILQAEPAEDNWTDDWNHVQDTDLVDVYEFYHKDCPSMPGGRYVKYVESVALLDGENQYGRLPVYRIVPSEVTNSTIGYTPSFDLHGPQEALNHEASTICSNHAAFGVQNVWSHTGNNIQVSQLGGALNVIESEQKPEPLQMCQTPNEIFEAFQGFQQQVEILSGVNSVARGQPEESLKSGAALALVDSKAIQAATGITQNYKQLIEDVGTAMIEILKVAASTKRVIEVVGRHDRLSQAEFSSDDLQLVSRVVVESGNAYTDTLAGKVDLADKFIERGLITTPQEYMTVVNTGDLDPLTDSQMANLHLIYDENERMQDMDLTVQAYPTDPHMLHIKEHQALLNSTEIRNNPDHATAILGHIMQHFDFLSQPHVIAWQAALGFEVPPMPLGPPGPMGGGMPMGEMPGMPAGDLGPMGPAGEPTPDLGAPYDTPGRPEADVNMPQMPQLPNTPAPPAANIGG